MSLTKRWLETQAEKTPTGRLARAQKSVRFALRAILDGLPDVDLFETPNALWRALCAKWRVAD